MGSKHLESLSNALNSQQPNRGDVWTQALLAFVGVAGPIWLAWLATKQIGQRSRLAEDYAFKASVAKAYEGYRKEAARLDEKLEARLFGRRSHVSKKLRFGWLKARTSEALGMS